MPGYSLNFYEKSINFVIDAIVKKILFFYTILFLLNDDYYFVDL